MTVFTPAGGSPRITDQAETISQLATTGVENGLEENRVPQEPEASTREAKCAKSRQPGARQPQGCGFILRFPDLHSKPKFTHIAGTLRGRYLTQSGDVRRTRRHSRTLSAFEVVRSVAGVQHDFSEQVPQSRVEAVYMV